MIVRMDALVRAFALLPLLYAVFFFSCDKIPFPKKIDRQPASAVIQLDQEDGEIVKIAEGARNTMSGFFRRLARPASDERNFCVKYPFMADEGSGIHAEHLWLTDIHFKDGLYYGILSGNPRYVSGMKKGDTVSFSADFITDWMYMRGDKIIGGYSIKYLLENIPEEARSEEQQKILNMF